MKNHKNKFQYDMLIFNFKSISVISAYSTSSERLMLKKLRNVTADIEKEFQEQNRFKLRHLSCPFERQICDSCFKEIGQFQNETEQHENFDK
ncbi:hypothetical protein T4B_2633 [Trichinella pseudospiralis]|uniref:Uncharacterized protein n=1 Tax=Trichinella pseudospiralis TaxID=6337 RepID=A0A0V1I0V8_TRIPS|nr:hypothetical protein T4B_2633 [Trichinella pseudospiralis]